ncbi:MAG: EamA family transporter [Planctomycetes bacterium]|nr:EamA family transporter [Planctomycetota bacterium]
MSSALPKPSRGAAIAALVALCLIWGSTWLVIADGLKSLPPLTSLAARSLVAAAVMSVAARWLLRFDRGEAPPWKLALAVGSLQLGLSYVVVYVTETELASGLTSLLWAMFPLFVAIGSHFFLAGERLRPAQVSGLVVGFVGVGVLVFKVLGAIDRTAILFGLLLLTSPLISTVSTIVAKRHSARVSSVLLNRNALVVAATLHLLLALVFEHDAHADWTPRAITSVLYLAVFGTAIAFGLYFWLLRTIPANQMSLISYVNPAVALFLGWSVGKEPVTAWTLAGSGLILAGVFLVVRARR